MNLQPALSLYYIHPDHLNTPRLVADQAQQTVWKWDQQEPFGNSPADENPSSLGTFDLPLRLPGQRYDAETALHYNYFRDFDPNTGRYVESDPIGLRGGLNTYAYVRSSPLLRTDPLGLQSAWEMQLGYQPVDYELECELNCSLRFFFSIGIDELVIHGGGHGLTHFGLAAGAASRLGGVASIAGVAFAQIAYMDCREECKGKGGVCKQLPPKGKPPSFADKLFGIGG